MFCVFENTLIDAVHITAEDQCIKGKVQHY